MPNKRFPGSRLHRKPESKAASAIELARSILYGWTVSSTIATDGKIGSSQWLQLEESRRSYFATLERIESSDVK